MRRNVYLASQVGVTGALFWLLFRGFDWDAFAGLMRRVPGSFYFVSLAVVLGGQVLYAWRWQVILRAAGVAVPFTRVLDQYFVGIFVNNFLPSTIGGDLAKVYFLGRDCGYRVVAASVALDRVLGIGMLATLAATLAWLEPVASPAFVVARLVLTAMGVGTCLSLALVMRGTGGIARRLARFGPRAEAAGEYLQRFRLDMAGTVRTRAVLLQAFAVIAVYFVALTLVYAPFLTLQTGGSPPFVVLMTVIAATSALSSVPVAINGLGLREQLHVLLLAPLGVPKETAVAISLLLFAHLLVASLIGGLRWMRMAPVGSPAPLSSSSPGSLSQP